MITNEQQYRATKKARDDMQASLDGLDELELVKAGIDPVLIAAQKESLIAGIGDLNKKLAEFAVARDSQNSPIKLDAIEQIGSAFISARISNGWTQEDLANRLGLKQQQVQRYERDRYRSASLSRIGEVAATLGLALDASLVPMTNKSGPVVRPHIFQLLDEIDCFPIASMKKRGWLNLPAGRHDAVLAKAALTKFFAQSISFEPGCMLNRRTQRTIEDRTVCALSAWQARLRTIAESTTKFPEYTRLIHSDFKCLANMTKDDHGPLRAVEFLEERGVQVLFLPHLEHTLLDGSSMLLHDGRPVIGLTLRQDRLDNFWYVLFHEIGHIIRHWDHGLRDGFLDDEQATVQDKLEKEADDFSRNALISDEIWSSSIIRYANSRAQLEDFAEALGVGVSVVAGRLRREKADYQLWTKLVGYGKVKKLFGAAGRLES